MLVLLACAFFRMEPRKIELTPAWRLDAGAPANVGKGATHILRTTRSGGLSSLIMKLRADEAHLQGRINDPLRRPSQAAFEVGQKQGKLTGDNPLDQMALLTVAEKIFIDGLLSAPDAVKLYLETRSVHKTDIRSRYYPALGGADLADRNGEQLVEARLLRCLPVARVLDRTFHTSNVLFHGSQWVWHYSLIPDSPLTSDGDFLDSFTRFFKATRAKEQAAASDAARGHKLTEGDLANIKACVGGQMGELLEFLICKGFDDESRRALGIPDGRARASIARYDAKCAQLPALRRAAEEHVQLKQIGTTGEAPTNELAAVQRRMQRLAQEQGLFLNETQAAIASAKRSVRDDPNVLRALQAIVRNMGASFKSEDGFTPADRAVLGPVAAEVDALWGTTGSQTERIHSVLQGFLAETGRSCALAETKRLMHKANITCSKYRNCHDPVSIAQHFAARQKKTVRMIVVLFSAYAFCEGLDYKSLFSVNSDKNNKGRGEMMVKSEKRQTFAHGAGGDCLGKLALFSTLLRPVHETDLDSLFREDVRPEDVPGWERKFFLPYSGLAVAFGHVHGTKGLALKETAASNMGHFWQKLSLSADVLLSESAAADYYRDPAGGPKPIMVQEMDNSHGAADLKHCFMLGLDFFLYDRDANIGASYAGQYSRFEAHECVNGSLGTRTNGAPIPVPLASPSTARDEEMSHALEICCDKLIAVANGATSKLGGGHVTVVRSNLDAAGVFKVRPAEIERFVSATEAERASFECAPMPSYEIDGKKVIDLYRLVWRCMQNEDPETRIYLRGPHLVQWVKRSLEINTFLKPHRAPAAFHSLLESWGGFMPVVVPSIKPDKQPDDAKDTGGSYAGLGESIDRASELKRLAGMPGKHYPPALLDELWKKPELKLAEMWKGTGSLPDNYWSNLRKILRQPRVTLAAEIERRIAMANRTVANNELEQAQEDAGIQQAVFAYMLSLEARDKRVPAMQTVLQTLGMPKRDVPKHRAQCVAEIFKRKALTAIPPLAPLPPPAATAAATAVALPATAVLPPVVMPPPPAGPPPPGPPPADLVAALMAAAASAEQRATAAVQGEAAVEGRLQEAEANAFCSEIEPDGGVEPELAGGASSGSEDEGVGDEEQEAPSELPALEPILLETVEDAERLLDAVAAHVQRPTSMWGCCGGVCDDERSPYYCDDCNLYYHHRCAPIEIAGRKKTREAPKCPTCRAKALEGGRSSRRRTGP